MQFAICIDDEVFKKKLVRLLREFFSLQRIQCPEIIELSSAEEMLCTKQIFDILFLDTGMTKENARCLGRKIREKNENVLLFMVISHEEELADCMDDILDLHVFRILTKILDKSHLFISLREALSFFYTLTHKLEIRTKETSYTVCSDDIIMVSVVNRDLSVQTVRGTYVPVQPFHCWLEQLDEVYFFLSHRSCLINMNYVSGYTKDTIYLCDNKYKAYLTVRKYAQFRHAYERFLFSLGKTSRDRGVIASR